MMKIELLDYPIRSKQECLCSIFMNAQEDLTQFIYLNLEQFEDYH